MKKVLVYISKSLEKYTEYIDESQEFSCRAMLNLGLDLARAHVNTVIYICPDYMKFESIIELIYQIKALGALVITEYNDKNVERLLVDGLFDACVIYHGIWDQHTQNICRRNGVDIVFAEAGVYDRENTLFVDPIGVAEQSSLMCFRPDLTFALDDIHKELLHWKQMGSVNRPVKEDYSLLLLPRSDAIGRVLNRHYEVIANVIHDLSIFFPQRRFAVRAHPYDVFNLKLNLPQNFLIADGGSIFDWSRHCLWAIGFPSKSIFIPTLYEKPTVILGRGVENSFIESKIFLECKDLAALNENNMLNSVNTEFHARFNFDLIKKQHYKLCTKDGIYSPDNSECSIVRKILVEKI